MAGLLVVDDDAALRSWAQRVLRGQGYDCAVAASAAGARTALADGCFDVAMLDVNMPGESGVELLAFLRAEYPMVAVVMMTGVDDLRLARTAIELGSYGYLVKPVRAGELLINVANALHRRRRESELRLRMGALEDDEVRTAGALRRALAATARSGDAAEAVQSDSMRRLVRLAEFRDNGTGQHMVRMGRYCELIGLQLGLSEARCERLRVASELHDIGKVGVPDAILLKPGKLTVAEFDVMKTHPEIGYRLLADSESELMRLAATVALTHHERWDGGGYPHQLAGESIALAGRIAAIGDVFDALTSDRVYRPAFPVGLAVDIMEAERGRQFEPMLLDAMHAASGRFDDVRRRYGD